MNVGSDPDQVLFNIQPHFGYLSSLQWTLLDGQEYSSLSLDFQLSNLAYDMM